MTAHDVPDLVVDKELQCQIGKYRDSGHSRFIVWETNARVYLSVGSVPEQRDLRKTLRRQVLRRCFQLGFSYRREKRWRTEQAKDSPIDVFESTPGDGDSVTIVVVGDTRVQ